jgi:hypothetical protein
VTNLLLELPDTSLAIGTPDTVRYGNNWAGQSAPDGTVTASFDSTGTPLKLSLTAFDIDTNREVEVLLNGESLGFLERGSNNGLSKHSLVIDPADQIEGENLLIFSQAVNPGWKWGVGEFSLDRADADLSVGVIETRQYGHRWTDQVRPDGEVIASFDGQDGPLLLTLSAYDVDTGNEVEVLLNGKSLGFLDKGMNDGLSDHSILIGKDDQNAGTNLLVFNQAINPGYKWGVADLLLSRLATTDEALQIGDTDSGKYGNRYQGTKDADGSIAFAFLSQDDDLAFTFKGYDIDTDNEVELFLNDVSQGYLTKGPNNGLQDQSFVLAAADQIDGVNELRFEQQINDNYVWGVKDLLLELA